MNNLNKIVGIFLATVVLGVFITFGCDFHEEDSINQATDLKPLVLEEDLRILADNPEILIGTFSGLAVDEDGIIYAADKRLGKIHFFTSNGEYLKSFGKRGKGPGEFENLDPKIRIVADTLYAKDNGTQRINMFNLKTRQLVSTINIPNANINGVTMGSASDIFPLPNGDLLISFINPYFFAPKEQTSPHMTTISLMNKTGDFSKKDFVQIPTPFPTDQKLVFLESEGMSVFSNLFFYPDIRMATSIEGHLYIGKSDSLNIRKYNEHGELTGIIKGAYQPKPLTNNALDSLSVNKGNLFKKAINEAGRPDYWPTFHDFLLDDKGNCWVQLINPGNSQQTWHVFNRDGRGEWEFTLPNDVSLYQVKNEKAYGISQSEDGILSIIRYAVKS